MDLIEKLKDKARARGREAYDRPERCAPPEWMAPQFRASFEDGWDERFAEEWAKD